MQQNPPPTFSFKNLFASLGVLFVVFLFSSSIIFPTLVNKGLIEGNFIKNGRYGVTNPALETIASQDEPAIITIGSSILEYATDGQCISERLHANDTKVYNLAISGGNPYTELLQVPALIEAKPKAVLLDLGPNALWEFFDSESLDEYIQFRFTILSITLPLSDEEGWHSLIRDRDWPYVATTVQERLNLTTSYSQTAFDNLLAAKLHEWFEVPYHDRKMPDVGGTGWLDYLQTPKFLPPHFEAMNDSEVQAWFDENMERKARNGVYNPKANGTLNHAALEYTIASLTNAGIHVFMVATPHHPMVYDYLQPGQIDGHNATLAYFEQTYGAQTVNWFWETWDEHLFRDRNHLGDDGRAFYCQRMGDVLNQDWT